jgi:hypothetical protein
VQLLQPVAVRIMVQFVERDSLPLLFHRIVPGLIWPDSWKSTDSPNTTDKGDDNSADASTAVVVKLHQVSGAMVPWASHVHSLRHGSQLIPVHLIAGSVLHHISILMTFGLCSITLSVCITLSICLSDMQWCLLVNRYLFIRLRRGGAWGGMSRVAVISKVIAVLDDEDVADSHTSDTDTPSQSTTAQSEEHGPHQTRRLSTAAWETSDVTIALLDAAFVDCTTALLHAIWPIIWVTAVFFALLTWDIAGDRAGIVNSLWIPVLILCTPVVLMCYLRLYGYILERRNVNCTVESGACAASPERVGDTELGKSETGLTTKKLSTTTEMSPIHRSLAADDSSSCTMHKPQQQAGLDSGKNCGDAAGRGR